jgi:outer membrane protein assembly factor BamB
LHRLNTSTGDDITQPVSVLPANARAAGLNMIDNVIYTVTSRGCNGTQDAVWAIDLNGSSPSVASFDLNTEVWGLGGPVIGSDGGTVYVQTSDAVLALSRTELNLKHAFTLPGGASTPKTPAKDIDLNVPSPFAFNYKGRDLIVAGTRQGRLLLLDSGLNTVLYETARLTTPDNTADHGVWGGISSWEDSDKTRWVLAPVWGPLSSDLKAPAANGAASNGSIVAFKVEDQSGKPVLTPAWVSRDLNFPMPPVIASGVAFVLSAGEFTRQTQRPKGSTHATLYALDALTGKELYSSRNLVSAPATLTGLTVANGRVYFGAIDGTFYAFGMYMEH